jgi:hypothetical protein
VFLALDPGTLSLMQSMFLSPDEMVVLTGRRQRTAQARVLYAMGIRYVLRPDGVVVVSREHVETVMRGQSSANSNTFEPNWQAA